MNGYTNVGMFYTALQTALLACVRYWLYHDSLRVPAKRMYVAVFVISCGSTGLWIVSGGIPGLPFVYFRSFIAVIMYVLSCFVIREPFAKHTYTYSFILVYDSALEMTASYLQQYFMPGERGWVFGLAAAILLAVTFLPSVRYLKRMIVRLGILENDRIWSWLCVISFSFVIMNLLFTFPLRSPDLIQLISRYLMLLGIIGLYFATTRAMRTMFEAAEMKAELDIVSKQVEIQKSCYTHLASQMDEVRRMRHDLRHYRAAITSLVQSGDTSALSDYVDAIAPIENAAQITGNLAVDSILLYYLDAAKTLGTRVETSLALGRETPLTDPDLCVILGNLLENAVDAQRYLPQAARFIRITVKSDAQSLTLAVDNRFDGALSCKNGRYLSRKKDEGHGLGLISVKAVCDKYGGVLQLETEGDLFMAGVVIGL